MSDPVKVFRAPFLIMKLLGLWQERSSSWLYRAYGLVFNLAFVEFFTLFHTFYLFHYESIEGLSDCISTLLTNVGECLKTAHFLYNFTNILKLVEGLKDLMKQSEREVNEIQEKIKSRVETIQKIFKVFCFLGISTCTLAGLVPIFNRKEHKLAYRMHFPYLDYKNNDTVFIILAIYQMGPVLICCMVACFDLIPVFFMCYAIGLLEELAVRLEHIGDRPSVKAITENPRLIKLKDSNDDYNELVKCMELHQGIKRFVFDIQRNFSTSIMIQGAMSSIILCTTAFIVSIISPLDNTAHFMRIITYAIPMVLEVFIPCYYGNEVALVSQKLSTSLYKSQWINSDKKFKKAMIIFNENLKSPIEISAVSIMKVNLATFTRILNFAYSLFALFKRVNQ